MVGGASHKDAKYASQPTPDELNAFDTALRAAKRVDEPDRYIWTAPCPRCNWDLSVVLEKVVYERAVEPQARCACAFPHEGRPPGVDTGCGFDVVVPIKAPQL